MPYIGNTPTTQSFISGTDYFNGTGSQTAFTLSRTVASVNDIQAVVNNVVQVPNDAYTISGTTITFTSAPSAGTQNVYVRYLSTTTQAITPSQNTVSWNTLDSNTQQDLGLMYKNKIINGNMVIDQRNAGAAVVVNNGGPYTLDRWIVEDGCDAVLSVQQTTDVPSSAGFVNSLRVTATTADPSIGATQYAVITQLIEGFNTADLMWGTANAKTVTVSFWVKASVAGQYSCTLYNNAATRINPQAFTINSANTWEYKTITISGDTTGTWLTTNGRGIAFNIYMALGSTYLGSAGWNGSNIYGVTGQANALASTNNTFFLTGVQLEVGTQATAFSTAGGSYGAELALCQRYFQIVGGTSVEHFASGVMNTNRVNIIYGLKQTMRASPSFSANSFGSSFSDLTIYWGAAQAACTGSNENYMSPNNASIGFTHASSSTPGDAGYIYFNSTNARVAFSAEL